MAATIEYKKILKAGLQANYDAMEAKDPNVLYFCTDSGKLYKGEVCFSDSMLVVPTKPATPVEGKVYFIADTQTVEAYAQGAWRTITYPVSGTIGADADDEHVPTTKAVKDAIDSAIEEVTGGASVVKSVAQAVDTESNAVAGHLTVTAGDGTTSDVALTGVATTPAWDADARKLTVPVVGGTDVVVNFGKDIFIDPTGTNGYNADTKTIDIYLNDGSGEEKPATKISIPAAGLVDVYTGEATNSTTTTVSDDNKISVDLNVKADGGLVVSADGVAVDFTAVNAKVQENADNLAALAAATTEWGTF